MRNVDTIITGRWVAPVAGAEPLLHDHALVVADMKIVDMLPATEAEQRYRAEKQLRLDQHILIPGLINTHTHAAMSLLRGLADDLPLMAWLEGHIWPAEARWVNEAFVAAGTRLSIAEMLLGGTTCFNDMYFFPDETGRVAAQAGIRATVGLIVIDFPTVWAGNADDYIDKALQVHDQFRDSRLINTAFAPHAPYSVSDAPLARIAMLAEELDIPVHMHVHETDDEVQQGIAATGQRPIERLHALGLLSPRLLAVHMTQLNDADIDRAQSCGINVVHCPESNMKLASGACPVTTLMSRDIRVALGTDGAASNNDLDMFGEMRSAALLAKHHSGDAAALAAEQALHMATLAGATALGIDAEVGSLEIGKQADIVAVNLQRPNTQPVYQPISQLVYAAAASQVSDVWVAGRQLVSNGSLATLDIQSVMNEAEEWRQRIAATS